MTRSFDLDHPATLDAALDRLVTGALNDCDRRALLLHLDAQPDGWRRCGLAFLEDQALRSALALPPAALVGPTAADRAVAPRGGRRAARLLPYALAAGLAAMAAVLGFRAGSAAADRQSTPEVVAAPPPADAPPEPFPDVAPGQPVGWVTLVNPAEGEALPRRVPVLAANEANEEWLREQPASIPPYVRAQWERRGYQVVENHRLVDLRTDDGQRVAIPVDEVAVDFVGQHPL